MTELQKDRLKDVGMAIVLLPPALLLSPLLVLIYWWNCLSDCWEGHGARHARNSWLAEQASCKSNGPVGE